MFNLRDTCVARQLIVYVNKGVFVRWNDILYLNSIKEKKNDDDEHPLMIVMMINVCFYKLRLQNHPKAFSIQTI